MSRDFILVERYGPRGTDLQPDGTRLLYQSESLEEMRAFVAEKVGEPVPQTKVPLQTDGGRDYASE